MPEKREDRGLAERERERERQEVIDKPWERIGREMKTTRGRVRDGVPIV